MLSTTVSFLLGALPVKKQVEDLKKSIHQLFTEKSNILKSKDEEIKKLEEELAALRYQEHQRRVDIVTKNIELFLEFVNEHKYSNCSDTNLNTNGYCLRCNLLHFQKFHYWPEDDYSISIQSVETKDLLS